MFRLNLENLPPDQKVIKAKDYQAHMKAAEIIQQAKEQADAISSQAKQAMEDSKKQGYQDGLMEAKQTESEHMVKAVAQASNYLAQFEEKMVQIIMDALKSILGKMEPNEIVLSVVKQSLGLLRNQKDILLQVNPDQVEFLQSKVRDLMKDFPGLEFIEVQGEARIGPKDCILKTDIGVVDATLDVQLKAIEQALKAAIQKDALAASP